jgi:hypothetical protein
MSSFVYVEERDAGCALKDRPANTYMHSDTQPRRTI